MHRRICKYVSNYEWVKLKLVVPVSAIFYDVVIITEWVVMHRTHIVLTYTLGCLGRSVVELLPCTVERVYFAGESFCKF